MIELQPDFSNVFIASLASLLCFVVVRHILSRRYGLGSPTLIAGLISGLGFQELCHYTSNLIGLILVPYAGLALLLVTRLLWVWFARLFRIMVLGHGSNDDAQPRGVWPFPSSGGKSSNNNDTRHHFVARTHKYFKTMPHE
jgi:hypothetical protein